MPPAGSKPNSACQIRKNTGTASSRYSAGSTWSKTTVPAAGSYPAARVRTSALASAMQRTIVCWWNGSDASGSLSKMAAVRRTSTNWPDFGL